jgi:hypothetical protein
MGPWTAHNSTTGGFYQCNKYEEAVKQNDTTVLAEEAKR